MKRKISKKINRRELADVLEEIAAYFRSGTFELEGAAWKIPDALEVKLKHKEKKGRIATRIEWHWSTLAEYDATARDEVVRWQESFSSVKKRLSRSLKAMHQAVRDGNLPDAGLLDSFCADSQHMAAAADPDWKEAMEEYLDHLQNLKGAVDSSQLEVVAHELRDLGTRMKNCHRDFK